MADTLVTITPARGTLLSLGKLRNLSPSIHRGIRHAWFDTGKDLMREADNQILRKKKTGVKYKTLRRRSSAPGESHANQRGALRRSLGWKVHGSDSVTFGYGVGKSAPDYARFVELGTPRGKMKARPTLRNTVKASSRNIEVNLRTAIEKEIS